MVLISEDILGTAVLLGEFGVTLAKSAITCVDTVTAFDLVVLVAVSVLDELANASVAKLHAGAFQAILVRLANRVKSIDWWAVAWVGHWAVAENKTVAAICPVLALIKIRIVVLHHISQL